ncbi:MAG: SLC13 family permease, partial [Candidatus Competibacteraceae bacterium]
MTNDQILILGLLLATMTLFLWGRWRHDMVALGALLACVLTGLVPSQQAFAGFGHPAVITVACILVLSRGLQNSGVVDALTRRVLPAKAGPTLTIAALTGLATVLSGFMNNVGALALLMPVAIQIAARLDLPPGRVLMPLAFGSILGGMVTLIGTPPNLIVAGFRAESGPASFGMFDFTPVGLAVAGVGVLFVTLVGWRLVPARQRAGVEDFKTGAYLTEARVPKDSKVVGMTLRQVETALEETDAQVVGLVRNEVRLTAPHPYRKVLAGDIVVLEAKVKALPAALSTLGLKLEEAKQDEPRKDSRNEEEKEEDQSGKAAKTIKAIKAIKATKLAKVTADADADTDAEKPAPSDDIVLVELAVLPQSDLVGHSASDIQLRTHYGINMLAVSRQGRRSTARLRTMVIRASDVLLMQGPPEAIAGFASDTGCVPLAERALRLPSRRHALLSVPLLALGSGPTT